MPKRVSINISLPNEEFKKRVLETSKNLDTSPSKEFVALYKRLSNKKK